MLVKGILCMAVVGIIWTVFGFVMGKAPKKNLNVSMIMLVNSALCAFFCLCIGLSQGVPQVSLKVMLLTMSSLFLSGFINYFQLDLMSIAMKNGPNGIVWSLIQAGFIFPFTIGTVWLGSKGTCWNITGVALIIVSLTMFGLAKDSNSRGKWKLVTMTAFVITGCCQLLGTIPSYFKEAEPITSSWRSLASASGMGVCAFLCMLVRERSGFPMTLKENLTRRALWMLCAPLLFVSMTENVLFYYPGMNMLADAGMGAIAFPLAMGVSIIAFEIYTIGILHETRNIMQVIALLVMILGTVALCFDGKACFSGAEVKP